jgi:N-acetylmuramoyl-L-alanine amidase
MFVFAAILIKLKMIYHPFQGKIRDRVTAGGRLRKHQNGEHVLMRKRKYLSSVLVLFTLTIISLWSMPDPCKGKQSSKAMLKRADQCRKVLYASPKKMKYRHNWNQCLRYYETIYTRHPEENEAAWALYHAGGLYRRLYHYSGRPQDLEEAIHLFRRLGEHYKGHRLADDGQYQVGEIFYEEKDDPTQAYVEFLKVDIKFPSGDMRPRARKKLDQLAIVLGQRDVEKKAAKTPLKLSKLTAIKDIRHWSTPNYTRVVVDAEGPVKYQQHLLKPDPELHKPRRLYLDLDHAYVASDIDTLVPIKDGLLQKARAGQYKQDTVRVVLDIESLGGYKVFHLHDPFRIVIDVQRAERTKKTKSPQSAKKKRPVKKGTARSKSSNDSISLARQLGLNVKTIVIDPGHGGKDPGCHAKGQVREKDITLRIAKLLAQKLEKKLDCEVYLTRTRDVFLPLEDRTAIANMKKADLFISLHINAHRNPKIHGLETYFLNMATDERAVLVAARENATSEKNISDLQTILSDLMMNTKIHESSRLARKIQSGMVSKVRHRYRSARDLGVKQAPFYVLIGAQMPAVLIETGFLTNAREKKRLVSHAYHRLLAEGISNGIVSYIKSIEMVYHGG